MCLLSLTLVAKISCNSMALGRHNYTVHCFRSGKPSSQILILGFGGGASITEKPAEGSAVIGDGRDLVLNQGINADLELRQAVAVLQKDRGVKDPGYFR